MDIYSIKDIDLIVSALKQGKTVAFGTDTVFGLACIVDNKEALNKIYKIKNRDINKKLPMMFSSIDMMDEYVNINIEARKLINHFIKGPITYILNNKDNSDTIACRIPDDLWIIELINKVGKPLYVTSANISNEAPLYKYEDVINILKDVDVVVKKNADGKLSSTIVDGTNSFKILREGPISKGEIDKVLHENSL